MSGIVAAAMICEKIYDVFILNLARQGKGKAGQDRARQGIKGDDRAGQGKARQ
jgi:hypothetical protein